MTVLNRVRVQITGGSGGSGVATFYTLDTATICASLQTFYTFVANNSPNDVAFQVVSTGDQIEDTTGALVGAWSGDAQAPIPGMQAGAWAAPVGAQVQWNTDTILDGHRVRGRTYIVPLSALCFGLSGQILEANRASLEGAALQLKISQATSLVIWHRPFAGRDASPGVTAKAAHLGGHALVTMPRVPSKVAVLRSRRD